MKFKIKRPPLTGDTTEERLDRMSSWLCSLSEALNVTLANLSEDNFNEKARERLFEKKEKDNE